MGILIVIVEYVIMIIIIMLCVLSQGQSPLSPFTAGCVSAGGKNRSAAAVFSFADLPDLIRPRASLQTERSLILPDSNPMTQAQTDPLHQYRPALISYFLFISNKNHAFSRLFTSFHLLASFFALPPATEILNPEYRILNTEYRIPNTEYRIKTRSNT